MPGYGEDPCGRGKRWMIITDRPLLDLPIRNPGQQRRSFSRFRSWSPPLSLHSGVLLAGPGPHGFLPGPSNVPWPLTRFPSHRRPVGVLEKGSSQTDFPDGLEGSRVQLGTFMSIKHQIARVSLVSQRVEISSFRPCIAPSARPLIALGVGGLKRVDGGS
ncbi:hypothetical protein LZ31DRAFT_206466 [Colletotrichum somersetense]|nr:hypothetical protein LZ31DRAFT_206466 [Colletotrichum somersetense]